MTREEIIFSIDLSARIERMTATLLGRVDRCFSFFTFLLGASVFASAPHWVQYTIALFLCAISSYATVFQPGVNSMKAAAQRDAYNELSARANSLSDEDLSREFAAIQKQDSTALGSLHNAAHVGECIRLDREPNIHLRRYERIIAWLAGDLPRMPPSRAE